ncbi:MAG: methionyl-tRNA formyltransferase [Candidatus Avigastranaerophilus sp.]|mgnify:CR=1 FL=1
MKKKYEKRILFIGMPDMALVCLHKLNEKGINIIGVVPPPKEDPTYSLMVNNAKSMGYELVEYEKNLNEKEFLNKIRNLNADLGVVASYNKKFPKELLRLPKDGFINLHPSKLPDYRGANPYSHVIINGEEESAITLHFMDEEFDTGDIISQYRFSLDLNETMGTLFYRTNEMCASMLYEALDYYESHEFPRKPQPLGNEKKKAYALSFAKRNVFIDWNKSAVEIERFIRALNPFIGAVTMYKGYVVRINSAKIIKQKHHYAPGTIIEAKKNIKIACGKDIIMPECLQYGGFFISNAKEFIERVKLKKGDIFDNG